MKIITVTCRLILFVVLSNFIGLHAFGQWEPEGKIEGADVLSLASNDTLLFAGTTLGVLVYHCNNPGEGWKEFLLPPDPEVTALAVYRDSLFVGTPTGVYKSSLVEPELINIGQGFYSIYVKSFKILEFNGASVLALILKFTQWDQLYFYNTDVCSWNDWFVEPLDQRITDVVHIPINSLSLTDSTFYIITSQHIWVSSYPGAPPYFVENIPGDMCMNSMIYHDEYLLAATCNGIFRKRFQSQENWTQVVNGPVTNVTCMHARHVNDNVTELIAGCSLEGIFWSHDNGETWSRDTTLPYPRFSITAICSNPDYLLAGTNGPGVFRFMVGDKWEYMNDGLAQADITSIAYCGSYFLAGTNGAGLFKSDSNGGFAQNNQGLNSLDVSFVYNAFVCSVVCAGGVLYYFDNISNQWIDFSHNSFGNVAYDCKGMYVNPFHSDVIYVAMQNGVYYNKLMQDHIWHPMKQGLDGVSITGFIFPDSIMYVSTGEHGVYQFNTLDSIWHQMDMSGLGNPYINSLEYYNNKLYAGTWDGVFYTKIGQSGWVQADSGITQTHMIHLEAYLELLFASAYPNNCYVKVTDNSAWRDRSDGFPQWTFLRDLMVISDNYYNYIYAATNRSLWKRALGEMNPGIFEKRSASNVNGYPNPCQDEFHIDMKGLSTDAIACRVMNLQGKTIAEFRFPAGRSGEWVPSITVKGLPSGLYLVELTTNDSVHIVKLVVE